MLRGSRVAFAWPTGAKAAWPDGGPMKLNVFPDDTTNEGSVRVASARGFCKTTEIRGNMNLRSKLLGTALLMFLSSLQLSAQITGDLRGVVVDSSGGAVAQAKVSLKSLETGESRQTKVDIDGRFNFSLLRIGNYEIRAEAAGFRSATTTAEVKTGEIVSARLALEVGSVTETVNVTDAVTALDTENSQIQTSFTGTKIQDIPVNRNPNLFALAAPGVAPVSGNNPFLGSGSFNSNGGRGRGNNITVDGITATDVSVTGTGGPLGPLNFSAIKEVKVITNNFSAEYGRNSSAQVLYITKNGTNELHGELYEYFQNDKLNARPFFDRTGKTNIVRNNIAGWELGGPVFVPKIFDGRNKLFWHTTYEQVWTRGAGAARIARVPTPAQLAGITNPTSRALATQYQLPTDPSGQIQTSAAEVADSKQFAIRGDLNLGSRDTVWARYSMFNSAVGSAGLTFIGSNLLGFGANSTNAPRQATVAETHLFGSSAVNEFRFGFGRSLPNFTINTPYSLGPRITIGDGSVNSFGVWEGLPQGRSQDTYQFTDNFSMVRGRHNLKMGGEYYYLTADSVFDALQRPLIGFASFADFQTGTPASAQQRFGSSARANRVRNLFGFIQDDWKVTRNLTLNLGLRMEWAGGPTESKGLISNLNLNNTVNYGAAGSGPFGLLETGRPSFDSNYNWGPRLGFAWSPGGSTKTVVRGGYGISYDFVFLNPITNQRFLPPFIVTGALTGAANFTGTNTYANFVGGTAQLQRETASQVGQLSTTALNFGPINPAIAQNLSNPQVHQWSLGLQRETIYGIVLKGTYVGTKGNFLPRSRDINLVANPIRPAANEADETARLADFQAVFGGLNGNIARRSNRIDGRFNAIGYTESSANSNFHSAQFEVQKRTVSGIFLNANYTYSKSIDDNSDVLGVLINDGPAQQDPRNNRNNRSASQFDLQQRLVITHSWEPRWGKNASNGFVRHAISGWGFSGISSFRTGFPVTFLAGARRGITDPISLFGGGGNVRPNVTGPVTFDPKPAGSAGSPFGTTPGLQAVSTYASSIGLTQPLLGNIGNLGRNVHRLNGERNFNWNVYKNFKIRERISFQIRSEFYNTFNNTSFQEVDRTITSPTFGQYQVVGQAARFIQLGGRFTF